VNVSKSPSDSESRRNIGEPDFRCPAWWHTDPQQSFTLGPRQIPGRIWAASGCFGYGLTGHDISSDELPTPYHGLGAVVTKTLTPEPRAGNPMPRLVELSVGALNSIGLENVGFANFLAETLSALAARQVPIIVSLAATRPEQFGGMAAQLQAAAAGMSNWHGVELNLSCPNIAEGGHDFGSDPATVTACVAAARPHLKDRALLAKLTPNVTKIAPLAEAARRGGADAVTAINTVVGLDVDLGSGRPILPRRTGGYSGPGILPIGLAMVDAIMREVDIPVVAVGGIASGADALKYFALGAVAVQVGTGQMRDPFAAARIAARLRPAAG
jgi:dihydroorotate dehydrogenase (NAD+) catalytic subunit